MSDAPIEQVKLLRVLKMIDSLKDSPKSIDYLMKSMDVSIRTVHRYLNLLEAAGFIVDKDFHNRYFIHTTVKRNGN